MSKKSSQYETISLKIRNEIKVFADKQGVDIERVTRDALLQIINPEAAEYLPEDYQDAIQILKHYRLEYHYELARDIAIALKAKETAAVWSTEDTHFLFLPNSRMQRYSDRVNQEGCAEINRILAMGTIPTIGDRITLYVEVLQEKDLYGDFVVIERSFRGDISMVNFVLQEVPTMNALVAERLKTRAGSGKLSIEEAEEILLRKIEEAEKLQAESRHGSK